MRSLELTQENTAHYLSAERQAQLERDQLLRLPHEITRLLEDRLVFGRHEGNSARAGEARTLTALDEAHTEVYGESLDYEDKDFFLQVSLLKVLGNSLSDTHMEYLVDRLNQAGEVELILKNFHQIVSRALSSIPGRPLTTLSMDELGIWAKATFSKTADEFIYTVLTNDLSAEVNEKLSMLRAEVRGRVFQLLTAEVSDGSEQIVAQKSDLTESEVVLFSLLALERESLLLSSLADRAAARREHLEREDLTFNGQVLNEVWFEDQKNRVTELHRFLSEALLGVISEPDPQARLEQAVEEVMAIDYSPHIHAMQTAHYNLA